jgi:hypothetical protein
LGKGYAVTLAAGVRPEDEAGVDTSLVVHDVDSADD